MSKQENNSESIDAIYSALTKFWGAIGNPKHNKTVTVQTKKGGQYSFAYTDLGGINDAIRESFSKNGLAYIQDAETIIKEGEQYMAITTKIIHESGQWIKSSPLIVSASDSIQDMGGQITYLKRYSLSSILGLATEQDDDAKGPIGNQPTFKNGKKPEYNPPKNKGPERLSMSQKNQIERLAKEYLKLRPEGDMMKLMKHLNITDLNLIVPTYADKSIEMLSQMIALVKQKDKAKADEKAKADASKKTNEDAKADYENKGTE